MSIMKYLSKQCYILLIGILVASAAIAQQVPTDTTREQLQEIAMGEESIKEQIEGKNRVIVFKSFNPTIKFVMILDKSME